MFRQFVLKGARSIFLALLCLAAASCAASRRPVPPGVIPEQSTLYSEDEKYGHEVLNNLTQQYPLDRDDARIFRVRDIVDRLTKAARADHNPWNVYVLVGDDFKNAAATRGNYIFVWTGILKAAQSDAELATILAHEIGHVLAGHTERNPAEETNRIIAGIAGAATGTVIGNRGLGGPVSDLAELVVRASLEAFLVNPDLQAKELEADQIGLFMMADAGYNPEEALTFWRRVQSDPDFRGFPIEFLSSHPSSAQRLEKLSLQIDDANERYRQAIGAAPRRPPAVNHYAAARPDPSHVPAGRGELWEVLEPRVAVHIAADRSSPVVETFNRGVEVRVVSIHDRWLEISEPRSGFVQSRHLAPKR